MISHVPWAAMFVTDQIGFSYFVESPKEQCCEIWLSGMSCHLKQIVDKGHGQRLPNCSL